MNEVYLLSALFLLLNLAAGLVRVVVGPTEHDRMLSAQLFGTTGVAALILLAYGLEARSLLDAALVLALLAAVAAVAFVRRARGATRAARER